MQVICYVHQNQLADELVSTQAIPEVTIEAAEIKRVSGLFLVHYNNVVLNLIVKIKLLLSEILQPDPLASFWVWTLGTNK